MLETAKKVIEINDARIRDQARCIECIFSRSNVLKLDERRVHLALECVGRSYNQTELRVQLIYHVDTVLLIGETNDYNAVRVSCTEVFTKKLKKIVKRCAV